jgi:type IV pilus assembly protein PilO
MSTATVTRPASTPRNGAPSRKTSWFTPLNLHWAAIALLVLLNLYLIVHLVVLWHLSGSYNATAFDQQSTELRVSRVAVQPLRGLDDKLAAAGKGAETFYTERLPQSYSDFVSELGALTRKAGVRLSGAQYTAAIVLPNSPGQLTEVDIDARLSGDYRPLVLFLNSLERDRMFFIIRAVTFNGQQSGTVNLRLQLTTYLRGGLPPPEASAASAASSPASTTTAQPPAGGAR